MSIERHEWVRTMKSEEVVIDQVSLAWRCKRVMYFTFKRIFDICCSLVGMIFLIPLLIIIKIAYMCSGDFHSVLYSQERIGKDGKVFRLHKFRTMVPNAEKILQDWLKNNPEKRNEYYRDRKIDKDPRITKVGNILRKTSLDEFPQFLNVFVGDMSLIGPRPVVFDEVENYGKNKEKFLSVRPGLTGYWASNGRSNISYKERMKMELFYVDHCCIRLDLQIIWDTIITVIKRDGAK